MKSLKDISWDVIEEEYRANSAISYSTLSTFLREGPSCIPRLKDKKEAEALRFGSLVDCLLLEPETFKDRFLIANMPKLTDSIIRIVSQLFIENNELYRSLEIIPEAIRLEMVDRENYATNWKAETRIKDITTKGSEFYKLSYLSKDKLLMSNEDYKVAMMCVDELKTNRFTKDIFEESIMQFSGIEKLNQLKFKSDTVASYPMRVMFDRIIVDHNNKIIRPIDLKTTGKHEDKFEESFESWSYWLQATVYTQVLQDVISKDEYFKDFTILPYYFVTINRTNLAPMIWQFSKNKKEEGFTSTSTNLKYPYWKDILNTLVWHIDNNEFKYSKKAIDNNGIVEISTLI